MKQAAHKKPRAPLDGATLERLGLHYVGRYATTRAKLRAFLQRKVRERGWAGEEEPPLEALVARFAALGYIDDAAFAAAKGASLRQRGFGERRLRMVLRAAGVEEDDAADAHEAAKAAAWTAALRFAERRRVGPFAAEPLERPARDKAFAAMMRAGHDLDITRLILAAAPGEIPVRD